MPRIPDYSDRQPVEEETRLVMPPIESPIETALHEALHVIVARLDGLDIADVVDQDDMALTQLVEPQRLTVAALMAPEFYMSRNSIAFNDGSMSSDRDAVAGCSDSVVVAEREWLEVVFQCPHVLAAISILSARLDQELREHRSMSGAAIHEIIDPILKHSPYADKPKRT